MGYEVTVKELRPRSVARKRERVSPGTIGEVVGRDIGELMGFAGRRGVAPAGPPLVVYPQGMEGDVEICLPIASAVEGEGDVEVVELPGGPIASTLHRGPYAEIHSAYNALRAWLEEQGREPAGPPREVYLTDPADVPDPADYVTEVDWPIR